MKSDILVSVIINNYNYEGFIQAAIESVLTQSYENFELIIVDDGSTDNSVKVIKKFENHEKVKIIYSQNAGQASAMNLGISNSNGELIAFLDSDDIFNKNKLQRVVELFKEGHEYIFHDYTFLSKITNLEKNYVYKYGGYYSFLVYYLNKYIGNMTSTLVLSRRLIDKIFPLENISEWKISSDALIVFSASLISDVYYEKTSLMEYRVHKNNFFYAKKILSMKYHRRLMNINRQKQKFIKEELIDNMYFRNSYNLLSEFKTHNWVDRSLLKDYYTVLFREMNLPLINKILTAYKLYKVYLEKKV